MCFRSVTVSAWYLFWATTLLHSDHVAGKGVLMAQAGACFVSPATVPTRSDTTPPAVGAGFTNGALSNRSFLSTTSNNKIKRRILPPLLATKKKTAAGGGGGGAAKKIQVKLLKHVAGTGQAGEVIMVAPAFYHNKLLPTKSAQLISDEQIERERATAAAAEKELNEQATELEKKLSQLTLTISRKAGPNGHLFGGIGEKVIAEELKKQQVGTDFFDERGVKIVALVDGDGNKIRGDIKHTGEFAASIALTKDLSVRLPIIVKADS